jgi:hypothetical protein
MPRLADLPVFAAAMGASPEMNNIYLGFERQLEKRFAQLVVHAF